MRARTADLLIRLIGAAEQDRLRSGSQLQASAEGAALCRSLWGQRNLIGTAFHFYCEPDRRWIDDLAATGQLWPRMFGELQEALDKTNYADMNA